MYLYNIYAYSKDSFDSLSPSIHISHGSGKILLTASSVHTELFNVSLCWLANIGICQV